MVGFYDLQIFVTYALYVSVWRVYSHSGIPMGYSGYIYGDTVGKIISRKARLQANYQQFGCKCFCEFSYVYVIYRVFSESQ